MSGPRSNEEVREFYKRWNSPVYTFCRLFLGDEDRAQLATEQAFVDYIRRGFTLRKDRIPLLLLRSAVEATKRECPKLQAFTAVPDGLEDALRLIPCEARSVFILRSVLDLERASVAVAAGLTTDEVDGLWSQAVLQIRNCWLKKG